ncbi:hypothetical protein LPJ79_004304 [Coemansia sp. RSA 1821]|nr:hypothetical protein LPJ79_004304 [Coemansia sp. RSA 1821]
MEGLTTAEAKKRLLAVLEKEQGRMAVPAHLGPDSWIVRATMGVTLITAAALVAEGASTLAQSEPVQTRGIGSVVAGGALAAMAIASWLVVWREARLEHRELDERLRAVGRELEGWGGSYAQEQPPQMPTVTTCAVRRDGAWRDVPTLLLVEGDVLGLAGGEATPCAVQQDSTQLEKGECVAGSGGRAAWEARSTPLEQHLRQTAQHHRRAGRSVLQGQMAALSRAAAACAGAVAGAVVVAGAVAWAATGRKAGVEAVLGRAAAVWAGVAVGALWPVLWLAARVLSSAAVVVLFDALQRSKTDYEDLAEIDEFDVDAPPPTKDVRVGLRAVARAARELWTRCDHRNLARSSNLAETLGALTAICSIDKEGTIAEPFCAPEQIVVPASGGCAVLDVEGSTIVDAGWTRFLPALRPLGLACARGAARHPVAAHRRRANLRRLGRTLAAQDSCPCRLGRAVGMAPSDIAEFRVVREIAAFARTDSQPASFSASVVCASGVEPSSLHVLSDGCVDAILGTCIDYFDGSAVRALDDRTLESFRALHENALQQDLQCLAFAYRPLALPAAPPWPAWDGRSTRPVVVDLGPYTYADDTSLPKHLSQIAREERVRSGTAAAATSTLLDCAPAALDRGEEAFLRDALSAQIFLGLVTFTYEPKTDVCDFIEDLDLAGIRFVHFSPANGRQSKSFAERLGLETDWNTCILLSADPAAPGGYVEDHDIKARLPRGIASIRAHLADVDDVPLQVSLFAECTPDATREMISILQDYGDVVCCIGSALNDANTMPFAAADLAVGIEPIPHFNRVAPADALDGANDGSISTAGALVTQYALGAALACIPCPLFLQHDTSLYALMQVIREARRLMAAILQAALLLVHASLALMLINLITTMCLLPPALPAYMVLWIAWIVVPLQAMSLLFAPHDDAIMSTMPSKNHMRFVYFPRFAVYAAVRTAPPIALTVLVYATCLSRLVSLPLGSLSSSFGRSDWLHQNPSQQWALLAAQTSAMVAFVFHCVCISATLMHRTRSLVDLAPVRNMAWIMLSLLSLGLSIAFAVLLLAFGDADISRIPWYSYVLAFAGPVVLLPLQELCKLHDKRRWTRLQKLAKLEFKTKLGLHSPL